MNPRICSQLVRSEGSLGISKLATDAWSEGSHIGDCALDLGVVSELAGLWQNSVAILQLVLETVWFTRMTSIHWNMWLGKSKMKGQGMRILWFRDDHMVTHGLEQQLCYNRLLKVKVTNGIKNDGSPPGMLAHWMHKKMQNNKKTLKNAIPWLLLTIISKNESERWAKLRFWPVETTDSCLRALAEGICWGQSIVTSLRA